MKIKKSVRTLILNLLVDVVKRKLEKYNPETQHMPFHYRLLGKDRYAMFSFIHSMNTTFGMSVWEQISEILAKGSGNHAERQYSLFGEIDNETQVIIEKIHLGLRDGSKDANKSKEIKEIKSTIKKGKVLKHPDSRVDFYIKIKSQENYFDITSVKPNMKEFAILKRKLLNWTALRLSKSKTAKIVTRLAIPYNPYYPDPYERWTLKGLYDLDRGEILIGNEYWNFIANGDIYDDLLKIFAEAGTQLQPLIDKKFSEYK